MINPLAVLVAALGGFLLSGAYYGVLGERLAALSPAYGPGNDRPAAAVAVVEIVRTSLVAIVLAVVTQGYGVLGAMLLALGSRRAVTSSVRSGRWPARDR